MRQIKKMEPVDKLEKKVIMEMSLLEVGFLVGLLGRVGNKEVLRHLEESTTLEGLLGEAKEKIVKEATTTANMSYEILRNILEEEIGG